MEETTLRYYFDSKDACPFPELFDEVSMPWQMVKAKDKFITVKKFVSYGNVDPSVKIKGPVLIAEGSVIEPFTIIEGPTVIGARCTIRSHVWIRPKTVIGDDCVVGKGVELKNSLLFNESKIGTNCFVGDSVLGKGARIGSGTIIGNRRFDQAVIKIRIKDQEFSTDSDKFGLVMGDFSRLGTNCATSPGIAIGKHSWIVGTALIKEFIPSLTLVKVKQQLKFSKKEATELKHTDAQGFV